MPSPEPGPDIAERLAARSERFRGRYPKLTWWLGRLGCVWALLAIPVLVLALIFVQDASKAVPVIVGTVFFLVQIAIVARSRTLPFSTVGRFCSLGAMLAVPIGLLSVLVGRLFDWTPRDDAASVFLAGPVEES